MDATWPYDAVAALADMLSDAGATVTFDAERNNQHPCFSCGVKPERGHKLVTLHFEARIVSRPFCTSCVDMGEPGEPENVTEREADQRTIQRLQEMLRKRS